VTLEPVRRHILLDEFDFFQSELARLHELETRFEKGPNRDELQRVHESMANIAAVIGVDLVSVLSSIDGLDLADERVLLVLGMLKRRRLRPILLIEPRKMMRKTPAKICKHKEQNEIARIASK
jgi:hypothetical protein